jgi:hypothetical protein
MYQRSPDVRHVSCRHPPSLSPASTNSHHFHHRAPPPTLSSITDHNYHHRPPSIMICVVVCASSSFNNVDLAPSAWIWFKQWQRRCSDDEGWEWFEDGRCCCGTGFPVRTRGWQRERAARRLNWFCNSRETEKGCNMRQCFFYFMRGQWQNYP